MKALSRRLFLFATAWVLAAIVGPVAGAANRPPARAQTVKPADRALRTKARIDVLLKYRLSPDPLPVNLPDPFQLPTGTKIADLGDGRPSTVVVVPKDGPAEPLPVDNDSALLARCAASLKITGLVKVNDQIHLIINQSPYKEGDLLLVNLQSTPVYLQIIRVAPGELTLGLNDAIETLRFKN